MQKISDKTFGNAKTKIFPRFDFSFVPAFFAALLPKCPLCLAAYMSVFGTFGISPLIYSFWILPVTIFFSAATIVLLFYQSRQIRSYVPFFLSLTALFFILTGKFYFNSNLTLYAGAVLLVISSVWLTISKRKQSTICSNCL